MLFHSIEYALFFVVVFLVFWGLHRFGVAKLAFLLVASWFFYATENPWGLILLLIATVVDFYVAIRMDDEEDQKKRRRWLLVSVISNLGLLAYFKYANFLQETVVDVVNIFGADMQFVRWDIFLPAGISFYTFMTLSYTVDVYRRQVPVERNFLRFAFFIGFFAHLLAGPIVRAKDFLPQTLKPRFVSRDQASRGLWLIMLGVAKKVVIADVLERAVVSKVFMSTDVVSGLDVLIGLYAYTARIYYDFSAYSDMAIGSALLLGYHLPDNFDRPYSATSISDFWRRWHKTMSSFLRDYVYFPLGGGRGTDFQVYRNLFITFFLIGLWHGANWNFALYGVGHALAMCFHRWYRKRQGKEVDLTLWGRVWRVFLTFQFVVFMRILFRAAEIEEGHLPKSSAEAWHIAENVTSQLFTGVWDQVTVMTPWLWVVLIGGYVIHWSPRAWTEATWHAYKKLPLWLQGVVLAGVVTLIAVTSDGRPLPFAYVQF